MPGSSLSKFALEFTPWLARVLKDGVRAPGPGWIKALIGFLGLQAGLIALDAAFPPDLSRARQASVVVLDRDQSWVRALPVRGGTWRLRADLDRTDPQFVARLIRMEDERFYWHLGVDANAVIRAVGSNMGAGRIVSGGSTLTMQTARLLTPHSRNFAAKVIEAARALQLELRYSKPEILSLYLTLGPYGGNLEGVRAASLSYLGHEPESLTLGEQALLIALPQSPEARRPDRHPKAAQNARAFVLKRMVAARLISPAQAAEANTEALPHLRQGFEATAWHYAGRLAAEAMQGKALNAHEGLDATVVSTLDGGLQRRLEGLAARTARDQGAVSSVAILVIELRTNAVRAAIGSGGLGRPGGWVDMLHAVRSPGSSLKPFIYGFGFDQGVVAPDTRLMDAPIRFGDYQPEDFDKVFHGEVSAREALINSLNVPAVSVLEKLGPEAFEARIEGAGIPLVRPRAGLKDAGLAIALGGMGIRLEDLARLYTALGQDGLIRPLSRTVDEESRFGSARGTRLMSSEAAAKVVAILRETPPPAGRLPGPLMRVSARPAFKTGTSYGFRDALAVGIGGGYVVLVWTGRPDGGTRPDMTGREASAPLLFDVFDQLKAPSQVPGRITASAPPRALKTLSGQGGAPSILFPPKGSVLYVDTGPHGDGLKLAARGLAPLRWYVDGIPVPQTDNGAVWRPVSEGFYEVRVVDGAGRAATSRVRVRFVSGQAGPQ